MLDLFLAGSQMPNDSQFHLPVKDADLNEQKRLAFGQFKKIYENQGDRASSLKYLALEMDAYLFHLIEKKKWWKIGEIFTLLFSKISTNHGYSWFQGFCVTIMVVFICFSIFLNANHFNVVACFQEGETAYLAHLYSYAPYYLNPLRDNDSIALVKDIDMTPWARIWDFISRIIVAYFVVQTVQVFRKLGKSSG